jgi:hypothetical protein
VTRFDELGQDESEDFSEVETGDHLFKGLLAGLVGRLVDDDVELGSRCEVFRNISGRGLRGLVPTSSCHSRKCWWSNESKAPHSHCRIAPFP